MVTVTRLHRLIARAIHTTQNDEDHPRLTGFCDWNGCHRNVLGGWNEVKDRFATLPEFSDRTM